MHTRIAGLLVAISLSHVSITPVLCMPGCVDYGDHIHWVANIETGRQTNGIAIHEDQILVTVSTGLLIIEKGEKTHEALGALEIPGMAQSVSVTGGHALVTSVESGGGLALVDLDDPADPVLLSFLETPGRAMSAVAFGRYALVADMQPGLLVVDIADPAEPRLVSTIETPGRASDVVVDDDCAFVADGIAGLRVLSLADSLQLSEVSSLETQGASNRLVVDGLFAYVAADSGLHVIDVSDRSKPELVGYLATGGRALDVAVDGGLAYVAIERHGMKVVDISNPADLAVVGVCGASRVVGIATDERLAYAADWVGCVRLFDISSVISPAPVGSLPQIGHGRNVLVQGNRAYVAAQDSLGLCVVDISVPSMPELVGYGAPGSAYALAAEDQSLCVVDWENGLRVYETSTHGDPVLVGEVKTGPGHDVEVVDGNAFVAANFKGLQVVDLSDPHYPRLVAEVGLPGAALGLGISANQAFVACGRSGVMILDVSEASAPVLIDSLLTGFAADAEIVGNRLLVLGSDLEVYDISMPYEPALISRLETPSMCMSIAVSGRFAYVANGHGGVSVVDLSDIERPRVVGSSGANWAHGVATDGKWVYVADSIAGFLVLPRHCMGDEM